MKVLRLLLIVTFVGICVAPTLQMLWPLVEERRSHGYTQEKTRPEVTLAGLSSEAFQRGFTGWYEQHYGFRPSLTRLDSSLSYYGFHEARPDKFVRVGKGDVLYAAEQVSFYNDPSRHDLGIVVKRIEAAQRALAAHGVTLVFMTNPTKWMVWRHALPSAWLDSRLPSPTPAEELRARFASQLTGAGVDFVDGWKVLEPLAMRDPEAVYTQAGRHLAGPAACIVTDSALRLAGLRLGPRYDIRPLDCSYVMTDEMPMEEEEYDLWYLLDLLTPRTSVKMPRMRTDLPVPASDDALPTTLVVGSSFGWKVVRELARNHAGRDLQLHYYGHRLYDVGATPAERPLSVGSPEWKELMLRKRLVIYVVPEEYIADYEAPFFIETIKAFGEPTLENAALVRR